MRLQDLTDHSYYILLAVLSYLDRRDLARLSVTTSSLLDICRDRMVQHVEFHGTLKFPLSTYASFCRFMLCKPSRLLLLETLFVNLTACYTELDDLGELDAMLGLDEPAELRVTELLETLLAPLLESAVNLSRLTIAGVGDLESFPALKTALVAAFARTRTLKLTGRNLIELLRHMLQLYHTIPLSRLFLQLRPGERWVDIWRLLEPCRNTLTYLAIDLGALDGSPIPPLESSDPWPLMSELAIFSYMPPVAQIFTSQTLRMVFPNLQHLRIPSGAVSRDEAAEGECEWGTLLSFSGHARTMVSLAFNCQLLELNLDGDNWALYQPRFPNSARHLYTAFRLGQPRCFSFEIFDVCTPFDEDLEDELCRPSLWSDALHMEYAHLTITEGPCCSRLLEFLVRSTLRISASCTVLLPITLPIDLP
ncbi:hypothetical protein GLOTRDRAFT_94322 [Gloeophyllum trabeum ATCC 11539]|uniref:F-box domain-containing protein n=1 Tax=Gloeophyllum trabeum (strain ATCC 11539 / FP-39264 / Madison 617) TaxID=670483 RepID=S7RHY5_GLOTA|nr:uncharacterized protein GLOTRDRAFT_94322 [Gloeophyllum trabeum ATCC 11539]EPQ53895.1 hypothetical protein GLOTRDRAFT_94322 [Gloeophyllum trabeum ATCC 11539]